MSLQGSARASGAVLALRPARLSLRTRRLAFTKWKQLGESNRVAGLRSHRWATVRPENS
jgi:hypothetical protein